MNHTKVHSSCFNTTFSKVNMGLIRSIMNRSTIWGAKANKQTKTSSPYCSYGLSSVNLTFCGESSQVGRGINLFFQLLRCAWKNVFRLWRSFRKLRKAALLWNVKTRAWQWELKWARETDCGRDGGVGSNTDSFIVQTRQNCVSFCFVCRELKKRRCKCSVG